VCAISSLKSSRSLSHLLMSSCNAVPSSPTCFSLLTYTVSLDVTNDEVTSHLFCLDRRFGSPENYVTTLSVLEPTHLFDRLLSYLATDLLRLIGFLHVWCDSGRCIKLA